MPKNASPARITSSEAIYHGNAEFCLEIGKANAIAAKVMASHRIPILDMHAHITRLTADLPSRAPQWETFGSNKILIHEPIITLIKSQLSLR